VSDFLTPSGQPFDPIGEAFKNLNTANELATAKARIAELEERNEFMREAGDQLWYVVRHAADHRRLPTVGRQAPPWLKSQSPSSASPRRMAFTSTAS